MKEFPSILTPSNSTSFKDLNYERIKCYLRRDIYEFIIWRSSENDYFDLENFNTERVRNITIVQKMAKELIIELQKLGWNCKTSFGCTGLFIYSTEKPPPNCFED